MSIELKINSASLNFIGTFSYEKAMIKQSLISGEYEMYNIYENNKDYFNQKYYSNWIHSFFGEKDNRWRQLKMSETSSLLKKNLELIINENGDFINYSISEIDIFLFSDNLGLFVIKTSLSNSCITLDNIIDFGANFRRTTVNKKHNQITQSIDIIENYITPKFHTNSKSWREFNPQLKSTVFIDIKNEIKEQEMDILLYQLGTFSSLKNDNLIYNPDEKYLKEIIDRGSISIFNNWKALCLYDSVSRVAINLNEKDTYKLWENEYILIYVYTLYARYFLHYTNDQLTKVFGDLKLVKYQRNNFYNFRNEFNHSKISYKFLPNLIYSKLKNILEIDEEIQLIDEKLTRTNILKQELHQKKINNILFVLTLLTLISVAYDGGQMLGYDKTESNTPLIVSICIIIISLIIILFLSKKKDK